jgi:DNA-binding NtrC family response regulator
MTDLSSTVYVVDDDAGMLESTQWLLESVGLNAEAYRDGRQFLDAVDPNRRACGRQRDLANLIDLQQLAQGGMQNDGEPTGAGRDDRPQSTGVPVGDLEITREFDRNADNISADVLSLFRELSARGVPVQDLDELRRLAAELRASEWTGNPALLEEEARRALALVEQLELALARTAEGDDAVRTNTVDEIPEQHREVVADYYRRLGEIDDSTDR